MPENDLGLVREGLLIENHFGWEDYNDLTTKSAPLELPLPDVWYDVPNDAQGPHTNTNQKVLRRGDTYDPTSGFFDFGSLRVGDMVLMRISLYFSSFSSNVNVSCQLTLAVGSGEQYNLPLNPTYLKHSGKHHVGITTFVYIGNEGTRSNPAKLQVLSDTSGVELEVDGYALAVFTRD